MIKHPKVVFEIENRFQIAKHALAVKIQSMWRGYVARKQYERVRTLVIICQRMFRRRLRGRQLKRLKEYEIVIQWVVFVQKNIRRLLARRAYKKMLTAAIKIRK